MNDLFDTCPGDFVGMWTCPKCQCLYYNKQKQDDGSIKCVSCGHIEKNVKVDG